MSALTLQAQIREAVEQDRKEHPAQYERMGRDLTHARDRVLAKRLNQ